MNSSDAVKCAEECMTHVGMCGRAVPPDVKVKLVLLLPAAGVKVYLGKRLNLLAKTRL